MRGLEELSENDKNNIVPLILLAPWVGSHTLEKSIERIEQAYGARHYFLDLDRHYQDGETEREAQIVFRSLVSGEDRLSRWQEFVERHEHVIPILQHDGLTEVELAEHIEWAEHLGRGYAFRFSSSNQQLSQTVLSQIHAIDHSEFGCFLDGGWSSDPLLHDLWFRGAATSLISRNEAIPIVTSASNFPRDFSDVQGLSRKRIGARQMFDSVRASNNAATFVYGDWASTKPRSYERSGSPLPRIDYATRPEWIIARNKILNWQFRDAAQAVRDSMFWNDNISTWGAYMIERTAQGDPFAINSTSKAVAARINLHLHMQANFAVSDGSIVSDDPWED
jgi:hypothetical protein